MSRITDAGRGKCVKYDTLELVFSVMVFVVWQQCNKCVFKGVAS